MTRTPTVISPHGKLVDAAMQKRWLQKRAMWTMLTEPLIRRSAVVAFSSEGEAARCAVTIRGPRIVCIGNGHDGPLRPPSTLSSRESTVLFLGFLDSRKRPDLLIRAFARARVARNHRLVFAGPDAYGLRCNLEKGAVAEGVGGSVQFVGPVDGVAKWTLLNSARCLVLPSRAEGLPVVLMEAFSQGLPVVMSPECNGSAFETAGAAVVVEGDEPSKWADAIDNVCTSAERWSRLNVAALALARQHTWHHVALRWRELYNEVAG